MLHRPRQQELVRFLRLQRSDRPPAQILSGQPHMLGTGLGAPAIRTDLHRIHPKLLGEPGHRHRRCRGQPVRHEPQPRQRAQRDRQPQPIRRAPATARIHERQISRGQREIPEQLLPADLREPPQTLQLLVREHPRRHEPRPPAHRSTSSAAKPSTNHPEHENPALPGRYAISARKSADTTATPSFPARKRFCSERAPRAQCRHGPPTEQRFPASGPPSSDR